MQSLKLKRAMGPGIRMKRHLATCSAVDLAAVVVVLAAAALAAVVLAVAALAVDPMPVAADQAEARADRCLKYRHWSLLCRSCRLRFFRQRPHRRLLCRRLACRPLVLRQPRLWWRAETLGRFPALLFSSQSRRSR